MEPTDPYKTPDSDVTAVPADPGWDESGPFSPRGRFGRLSYLAWASLVSMTVGMVLALLLAASMGAGGEPGTFMAGNVVVQLTVFALTVVFVIRRLHDFDASGWWSLLVLVPVVNFFFALVLLFKGGSEGSNRFGPPRRTRGWEKVLAYLAIAGVVLGILSALFIPALLQGMAGL